MNRVDHVEIVQRVASRLKSDTLKNLFSTFSLLLSCLKTLITINIIQDFRGANDVGRTFGEVTIFTLSLKNCEMTEFGPSGSTISAIQSDAIRRCDFGEWSSLQHIMALSTAISRNILNMYPDCANALRPLLRGFIRPRPEVSDVVNQENQFYILWSMDGTLNNRPSAIYVPNHFVPLFKKE